MYLTAQPEYIVWKCFPCPIICGSGLNFRMAGLVTISSTAHDRDLSSLSLSISFKALLRRMVGGSIIMTASHVCSMYGVWTKHAELSPRLASMDPLIAFNGVRLYFFANSLRFRHETLLCYPPLLLGPLLASVPTRWEDRGPGKSARDPRFPPKNLSCGTARTQADDSGMVRRHPCAAAGERLGSSGACRPPVRNPGKSRA